MVILVFLFKVSWLLCQIIQLNRLKFSLILGQIYKIWLLKSCLINLFNAHVPFYFSSATYAHYLDWMQTINFPSLFNNIVPGLGVQFKTSQFVLNVSTQMVLIT